MDPHQWNRVTGLFAAAIELPLEDRARFLARHERDPAVRTLVSELLAADLEPARVLSVTAQQLLFSRRAQSRDAAEGPRYVPPPTTTEMPP